MQAASFSSCTLVWQCGEWMAMYINVWEKKAKAKHEKHIIMESEILNEFRKWIFIMFMNAQVAYDNMRCGGANIITRCSVHTVRKWGWRYKKRINFMI